MCDELIYIDDNIIPENKYDGYIEVLNMDTLDGAIELKTLGYNPILLNMCNPNIRGGYHHLTGAQEEDLVRRGNYLSRLENIKYPLPKLAAIYSPDVLFDKYGLRQNYKPMQEQKIDVVACAAIQNTTPGIFLMPSDAKLMAIKIELIFQIAYKTGHDSIILSAFGCGGFRNPPEHISRLFEQSIERWKESFRIIRFCIFDENYPKSNFAIFKKLEYINAKTNV